MAIKYKFKILVDQTTTMLEGSEEFSHSYEARDAGEVITSKLKGQNPVFVAEVNSYSLLG